MELATFGAICKFAIELERQAAEYYERGAAGEAEGPQREALARLGRAHRKRLQAAEQMRREIVTEMILEPIYGLRSEDWQLDLAASGWGKAVELEATLAAFYAAAAGKVSIPQAARMLRKLGEEAQRLGGQAGGLAS